MVPIYDAFEDRTTFHDNDNDNSNLIVYGLSRVNIMAMSSAFKIWHHNNNGLPRVNMVPMSSAFKICLVKCIIKRA